MKMYLCSYRVAEPQALEELLGQSLAGSTATVINNSKDRRSEEDRMAKNASGLQYWHDLTGGGAVMKSLLDYTDTKEMKDDITSRDILVFLGGDNEALRSAMIASGFDSIAKDILDKVVYVGESAGAIVVGPNLSLFRSYSKDAGVFMEGDDAMEGLGIIEDIIFPHEDSPDPRYADRGKAMAANNPNMNILPLGDLQALIINGQTKNVIGNLRR